MKNALLLKRCDWTLRSLNSNWCNEVIVRIVSPLSVYNFSTWLSFRLYVFTNRMLFCYPHHLFRSLSAYVHRTDEPVYVNAVWFSVAMSACVVILSWALVGNASIERFVLVFHYENISLTAQCAVQCEKHSGRYILRILWKTEQVNTTDNRQRLERRINCLNSSYDLSPLELAFNV